MIIVLDHMLFPDSSYVLSVFASSLSRSSRNVGVRPGGLVYLIQGLGTPSIVDVESSESIFRGTCYMNGLMDVGSIPIDDSVYIDLV
jgi:hypothetical protein